MNNVKSLSIALLLSMGVVGFNYARSSNGDCSSSSSSCNGSSCDNNCHESCDHDCGDSCDDRCNDSCENGTSTFFRARPTSTDLTYRNNLSFYQRYHDSRCNFFTWDSSFIFQKSRHGECIGTGFFGTNPITFGESADVDFNSINIGLGRTGTEDFEATVHLNPERRVFAWLPQFFLNLDCFCTGLWADLSFAVVSARHRLHFTEDGNTGNITDGPTTVREALNNLNVFAGDCRETGVDDVVFRLGYDYTYCANDHLGVYFLGIAPTSRKHFDNARWFQPHVGSRHGAVGAGFTADYTIWCDEVNVTDFVFQTELLYQYRLKRNDRRVFDLFNGVNSRFLLATEQTNVENPVNIVDRLSTCVSVEPRHQIDWWANFHYQWCNWGAEFSYNLWWRDCERVRCKAEIDFDDLGIFDMTRCDDLTSNSGATIATPPPNRGGTDVADAAFTLLTQDDVNFGSGVAHRALTHKISAAFSYNNVWCDCYPFYVALGGGYEFASNKHRLHALENWHVYGKWGFSF